MFMDNEARENEGHENENKSKCSMNVVVEKYPYFLYCEG